MPGPFPQPHYQQEQRAHVSLVPQVPQGYQAWPGFSRCLKSLKQLLKGTVGNSASIGHERAPFNSRSICLVTRSVINVPAAFDAAANAAGIALANAEGVLTGVVTAPTVGTPSGGAVQLLTPSGAAPPFQALPVLQLRTPPGYVTVVKSWGITVRTGRPEAAVVTTHIQGGPNTGSTAPDPLVSGALRESHQPTTVIVPDNKLLQIHVQNIDTHSPIFVVVSICGWALPVRQWTGRIEDLLPSPGYGVNCEEF